MNKQEALLQLFMCESSECELFSLDSFDLRFPKSDAILKSIDFIRWHENKREISHLDVAGTHWIKTNTGGYVTEVVFHKDGTFDEAGLFDQERTRGMWHLSDGILKVEAIKNGHTYNYNVVGNSSDNIHSAVEQKNNELNAYLKLVQIK